MTREGADVGQEMRRRHKALYSFLTYILKIDPATANEEACQMEHFLSPSTLVRITDFMEFVQVCPRAGDDWINRFEEFREQGKNPQDCQSIQENGFPCEAFDAHAQGRCNHCSKTDNED